MKEIFEAIEALEKKIENVEDDKNKEIFNSIHSILGMLSNNLEEIIVKQESLDENVGYLGEDLTNIQDELFEELSYEELADIEDEYVEINCVECNKPIFVEKSVLDKKSYIPCPFCNEKAY